MKGKRENGSYVLQSSQAYCLFDECSSKKQRSRKFLETSGGRRGASYSVSQLSIKEYTSSFLPLPLIGLSDILSVYWLLFTGLAFGLAFASLLYIWKDRRPRQTRFEKSPLRTIDLKQGGHLSRKKWIGILLASLALGGSTTFILSSHFGGTHGQDQPPVWPQQPAFTQLAMRSSGIYNTDGRQVFLLGVSGYDPFSKGRDNTYPENLFDDGAWNQSWVTWSASRMKQQGFSWAAEVDISPDMILIDSQGNGLPSATDTTALQRFVFLVQSLKDSGIYVQVDFSPAGPARGRSTFCRMVGYFSCGGNSTNYFPQAVRVWMRQLYMVILGAAQTNGLWNLISTDIAGEEAGGFSSWATSAKRAWFSDIQSTIKSVDPQIWVTVSFVGRSSDGNFGILTDVADLFDIIEVHDYEAVARATTNWIATDLPQEIKSHVSQLNLVKPVMVSETGRSGGDAGPAWNDLDLTRLKAWYRIKAWEVWRSGLSGISYWGVWRAWDTNTVPWSFYDQNYQGTPLVGVENPMSQMALVASLDDAYASSSTILSTNGTAELRVSGGWKAGNALILYNKQGDGNIPNTTQITVKVVIPQAVIGKQIWLYSLDQNHNLNRSEMSTSAPDSIQLTLGAWSVLLIEFK